MDVRAETGAASPSEGALLERLLTRGWQFDFFQAAWLLERYCGDRMPVGGRGPVSDELIRFRPEVSMSFPATDVRRITARRGAGGADLHYRIDVTFMGLYGVSTPLPLHYAVDILRAVEPYQARPTGEAAADAAEPADSDGDSTPTRDFLDIFHHRLVSLFYRSWAKYRYHVTFGMPGRDTITEYLLWLVGCARGHDEAALGVNPARLIRYAGLLTHHPRPAVSLEGLLCDYWHGMPARVHQCIGRWVPLTPADLNVLGMTNCQLGVDLTVGEQVYDLSGAFNITLGPMDWATYLFFLPGEWGYEQTRSLVHYYCSDPLSFTIEIKLLPGEAQPMHLSTDDEAGRLGLTSWVGEGEAAETSVTFVTDYTTRAEGGAGPGPASAASEPSYAVAGA